MEGTYLFTTAFYYDKLALSDDRQISTDSRLLMNQLWCCIPFIYDSWNRASDYSLTGYSLRDYAVHELNTIHCVTSPFSGVPLTEPCCSRISPLFSF